MVAPLFASEAQTPSQHSPSQYPVVPIGPAGHKCCQSGSVLWCMAREIDCGMHLLRHTRSLTTHEYDHAAVH